MSSTTLSPEQIRYIEQHIASQPGRVQHLTFAGQSMIIKRQESRARPLAYGALNLLAKTFRQPILAAVPAFGGAQGQATEVHRLRALAAAGVSVPQLLHVADDWIALSDAGPWSIDWLLGCNPLPAGVPSKQAIWEAGLAAILATHQKGQMLSQAFARNMHWQADEMQNGRVIFIDFEDDPTGVLAQEQGQARDWLLYLHSTAYLLDQDPSTLAVRLQHYIAQDTTAVQTLIKHSTASLSWLRFLPTQRKPWGRDVVSLQGAGTVMHQLAQLLKVPS
ncbi:hypothetical protein [Chitinibacter sp. S2-10]|uniref:hypothetical protein n=1 Tax=Chitinibacter sp. S2-10 TaxID=3373597 RepID=UPI003977DFA8